MSSKSKYQNNASIQSLVYDIIHMDMYHPQLLNQKNQQLNRMIEQKLATCRSGENRHIYESIKNVTDQLASLSHAAIMQPIVVRMVTNQRFQQIQLELRRLHHQLQHGRKD